MAKLLCRRCYLMSIAAQRTSLPSQNGQRRVPGSGNMLLFRTTEKKKASYKHARSNISLHISVATQHAWYSGLDLVIYSTNICVTTVLLDRCPTTSLRRWGWCVFKVRTSMLSNQFGNPFGIQTITIVRDSVAAIYVFSR